MTLKPKWAQGGGAGGAGGESSDGEEEWVDQTYPECLYLYKTLMFFVFRVRLNR